MKKLNWKKIRKTYPKSFAELVKDHLTVEEWGHIDNPEIWDEFVTEEHYVMRHLFDFFDSKHIYIEICRTKSNNKWSFKYGTDFEGKELCVSLGFLKSRKEAEIHAWTESFKIFEKQLTIA